MTAVGPDAAVDAYRRAALAAGGPIGATNSAIQAGLEAAAPLLLAAEIARIRALLVPELLRAVRCIPDGVHRSGCVVNDGATVRRRLKDAYREAFGAAASVQTEPGS